MLFITKGNFTPLQEVVLSLVFLQSDSLTPSAVRPFTLQARYSLIRNYHCWALKILIFLSVKKQRWTSSFGFNPEQQPRSECTDIRLLQTTARIWARFQGFYLVVSPLLPSLLTVIVQACLSKAVAGSWQTKGSDFNLQPGSWPTFWVPLGLL